jgi:hypothetical protein
MEAFAGMREGVPEPAVPGRFVMGGASEDRDDDDED